MAEQPRWVTLRLRPGVYHAVLPAPDRRRMVAGDPDITVEYDTFKRIAPSALARSIQQVDSGYTPKARKGFDLTFNGVNRPTFTNGQPVPAGYLAGGFAGTAYRLVKAVDATLAAGDSVCWADFELATVTKDRVGGSAASPLTFAGIAIGAITASRWGWIQVDGQFDQAVVSADVGLGDAVEVDPTTDGSLQSVTVDEVQVVTLTGFGGTDSFKLTYEGQETAAIVRGTNAAASDVQTALEALSTIGAGNVSVSGTTDAGPYTVEFIGDLADNPTSLLSVTSPSGCTGVVTVSVTGGAIAGTGVGTCESTPGGGKADVTLRWLRPRRRIHSRPDELPVFGYQ